MKLAEAVRETIQDCNLNFLLGSGLSSPYLKTVGRIEELLTRTEDSSLSPEQKKLVTCSLYKNYFDDVISKNCNILERDPEAESTLGAYSEFLETINSILLQRKSTILGKVANLFTTNIDIFLEKAIERIGFECNDGFTGRFEPRFEISNFKKSHFKKSLQYDNRSEVPTVNLLKLHGSLTWEMAARATIVFATDLRQVREARNKVISPELLHVLTDSSEAEAFESLISHCDGKMADATVDAFLEAYDALAIVNPTKAKFRQTLLNQTHYELLRIYSNELEKENTVLFVLGFSFADEHIREITLRAANSNPTLMIYVIAYDSNSATQIGGKFPALETHNNNIRIIPPDTRAQRDVYKYDLRTINSKIFNAVLESTQINNQAAAATHDLP